MKQYLKADPWSIVEEGWNPEYNEISESIFSIGNGRFGQRANFEEVFSGKTLQGSYVGGIYYPDKTKVGWWKIGYPEYFAKVLNAPSWIGIPIDVDGEKLDLAKAKAVKNFKRELNMKCGLLSRSFEIQLTSGKKLKVSSSRFCSITDDELGVIRYEITPLNFSGTLTVTPDVDADVVNQDSNYDEKFWIGIDSEAKRRKAYVVAETKKTEFQVCTSIKFDLKVDGKIIDFSTYRLEKEKYAGCQVDVEMEEGKTLTIEKYASVVSSLNYAKNELVEAGDLALKRAHKKGFDQLFDEHAASWTAKWLEADISIEGDVSAQQAIRFNIFQLYQTYTGEDERLNIGPKGFTGEKYGGSTYWDTEAYCLPFYLATADQEVGRNLLIYRYKHLQKAIENAAKLGFTDGAALYPMVTINGEECHNEWEITFEEIHRNGAIAYAIYDYIRYTGDKDYLISYGLEVLIGIARFWAQRVHWSERNGQYMMHGVTGPNEYENNVNNNWYTNYLAVWCLKYALEAMEYVEEKEPTTFEALSDKIKFYKYTEIKLWKEIIEKMYFPEDKDLGIFVQHDGFLDKELMTVSDLKPEDRPINQNWSWDRILRSVFIKQADVLQGMYFFDDDFSEDQLRTNFDFYEPRTVHESSLSPCVHSILAAALGKKEKAYEMYLRTARLDLDDINNDTEDGCHITSMAGTWMAVVKGFGGFKVKNDRVYLSPFLPDAWQQLSFKIRWRGSILNIIVSKNQVEIQNLSPDPVPVNLFGKDFDIKENDNLIHPFS
ncbi:MAG: glycoside hydrolase family 65 protein [Saprospiraceae bacterium]|nr:glycoside hydrolase family 65 protein [Saprospiraceae bacterium]